MFRVDETAATELRRANNNYYIDVKVFNNDFAIPDTGNLYDPFPTHHEEFPLALYPRTFPDPGTPAQQR